MVRFFAAFGALVAVYIACAACFSNDEPQAAPNVNVTNVLPASGDSGLAVLLTVAGGVAFLLFGISIVLGAWLYHERRRRTAAESVVRRVTGYEVTQLILSPGGDLRVPEPRAALTQGVLHER